VTARAGDTVATLAGRMMGTERKLDLFRLINAMTATSTVRPGEKFKIISE
jgi:predicted Zn-dependent protease